MEERETAKEARVLIEKHRKNTGKYLHLVQDLVASGQRIDLEATKAKIEGKYGLKLKPGEANRQAAELEAAKESPSGAKFCNSEGKIDTEQVENFIEAMRRKYVKAVSPSAAVPTVQAFFPRATTPDTSTSLQDASFTAAETQLIDLSPCKETEIDLLSGSPRGDKQDYSIDLASISFEAPPLAVSPEPQLNATVSDLMDLRRSRKKYRLKTEDFLNDILGTVVDTLFSPEIARSPELKPSPKAIFEEITVMETIPKRKTSPLRSFATFLKGDEPSSDHPIAKIRPGRMKVTKAKLDPDTILSKDSEYQQLLLREQQLQARLTALSAAKKELRASLEAK